MYCSPQIANLPPQSLQVPGGWRVTINHFYELDPDDDLDGREILHLGSDTVTDPWEDVLFYYFDMSYLWQAIRSDNRYLIYLDWTPMGARDGQFVLHQFKQEPSSFAKELPKSIHQKHEGVDTIYDLVHPLSFAAEPDRIFESRDRLQIVDVLNRWLNNHHNLWE